MVSILMNLDSVSASLEGQDLHHANCFACGSKNDFKLDIQSRFDPVKREVRFPYRISGPCEGAPGHAHGGFLATLVDEAQGVLCHHLGYFVMTDNIFINYRQAVPLRAALQVRAWITMVRRKRLYTKATICDQNGKVLLESKARWYIIPDRLLLSRFSTAANTEHLKHLTETLKVNKSRRKRK